MKCLSAPKCNVAVDMASYEREVKRNTLRCPQDKFSGVAVGLLGYMAASTNGLLPCLPDQELYLAWLGINDVLLLGVLIAALVTIMTETAVPGLKERLAKPGLILSDTREEALDDWTHRCDRCVVTTPVRTFHCPHCHKCTEVFDHHCGILGVCIGKANHRAFLVTMISALLYLFSSLAMVVSAVGMVVAFGLETVFMKEVWVSLMVLTGLVSLLPIGVLLQVGSYQVRAALMGVTQYEWFVIRSEARDAAAEKAVREAAVAAELQEAADRKAKSELAAQEEAAAILAFYSDVPEIVVVQ